MQYPTEISSPCYQISNPVRKNPKKIKQRDRKIKKFNPNFLTGFKGLVNWSGLFRKWRLPFLPLLNPIYKLGHE